MSIVRDLEAYVNDVVHGREVLLEVHIASVVWYNIRLQQDAHRSFQEAVLVLRKTRRLVSKYMNFFKLQCTHLHSCSHRQTCVGCS